jgi:hypothetical protein
MSHSSIPTRFWDEIFSSIVFLINRLPSKNLIPCKELHKKDFDYNFLRVLGCLCYPLTQPYNKHKLELRFKPCVFIGYGINQKGYCCLHIPSGRIYVSRNVQFIEHEFLFAKSSRDIQGISSNDELKAPLLIIPSKVTETEQGASTVGIQIPAPSNSNSGPTTALIPQLTNPAQSQLDTAPDPTHNLNDANSPPIVYK